jgi:hypothetical protein
MRPVDFRNWLRREPFKPFRIHLTNGATFEVRHPEQAAVSRATVDLAYPNSTDAGLAGERAVTVVLLHITHLEPIRPAGPASPN